MRRLLRTVLLAGAVSCVLSLGAFAGDAAARDASPRKACATVTLSGSSCGQSRPVASLQPKATRRLWHRLVAARRARPLGLDAVGDCRPLRAVFYTATDWMRLATTLAANSSPCAQYYFSIPSLAADHTQLRADQAWRIRALGPQFHAMAEISMAAWGNWVTSTGNSWYQAGVEARRRMEAAGYDVSAGDSWAVNEFSSAVRQGTGTARVDARNFVHGLYDGDGTQPAVRGAVFIIGMGQGTQDLSVYKTNLEGWLSDSAFWADMSRYVSDWSQELFGDYRNYGVAGASLPTRRDALNAYLQHIITQANAGAAASATASGYLQTAYSPLANAAWQYDTAFGWTLVSLAQMEDFVSAQTYALRAYDALSQPNGIDHWGFAWSPKNATGMSAADFDTQSGQLIVRIASAIHDSDHSTDPSDPGSNACGIEQNWCTTAISGAAFNLGWQAFAYWGQLGLAFTTPSQAISAGSASAPINLQLQASGTAQPATGNLVVTLSSNSATGSFSLDGVTWTPTLQLTVPVGASATPAFSYRDTRTGNPIITGTASGAVSAAQPETVGPASLASLSVTPATATMGAGSAQTITVTGTDTYGNVVPVGNAIWSVSPAAIGTVSPAAGPSTTFTAGMSAGSGVATAGFGGYTASVAITVAAVSSVPAIPTHLTARTAASKGVALAWTAPASQGSSPITSYRVYRGTRSGGESLLTTLGNLSGYADTATKSGTTYYYEVAAVSAAGQSAMSSEASARAR
jgi:Fibronectin type III domain